MSIIMRLLELEKRLGLNRERIEDNFIEALIESSPGLSEKKRKNFVESRDWLGLLNATAAEDWSDYEHTKTD